MKILILVNQIGIFGHSMGGGGAIQCALKNHIFIQTFHPIGPIV